MSLGQMVVELSLDGSEFTLNLKKADGQLAQFIQGSGQADRAVQRAERSTRSWGHALRDSVVVLSLIRSAIQNVSDAAFGWQRAIVSVNSDVQRSIQLMKSFSKETSTTVATQEALADVQMLMEKASKSPFDLDAITDSFVKLRVAGVEPARQSLGSLIDSVAAFGGSSENLKRAGVAIQQMAGKGVVSMEELRQQLGEAVPTAIQNMADGLGVSYAKLVKEISLGRVKSEPALMAMMREMEIQFKGSAERMMNTWAGAVARFSTEAKKLALEIGGLGEDGYAKDGYMSTLTAELNNLSTMMADPQIRQAAAEFGRGLATIVKAAADGIHWLVEYREKLYELAKAALIVYGSLKTMSIMRAVLSGTAASIMSVTSALTAYRQAGMGASAALTALNPQLAASTQKWAAKAGAVGTAGRALGLMGGVLAGLTGPIGMAVTAIGSITYALWESSRAADANVKSLIEMKGLYAGAQELATMQERVAENNKKIADAQRDIDIANGKGALGFMSSLSKGYIDVVGLQKKIQELKDENLRLIPAMAQAAANVTSRVVQAEVLAANNSYEEVSQQIQKRRLAFLEEHRDKVAKAGGKEDEALHKARIDADARFLREQYEAKQAIINKLEAEVAARQIKNSDGSLIKLNEKEIDAKQKAVELLRLELGKLGEDQERLLAQDFNFGMTNMDGNGSGGPGAKFDPLIKFWQSLTVNVAKADAVIDEANPHLAQMNQIIANMGDMGMKVDAGIVEKVRQAAAARWEQEKAVKAVTTANNEYKDSVERLSQIEKVLGGKLGKAENDNPWLKASTDAKRYIDEIGGIEKAMAQYRETAMASQTARGDKLVKDIDAAAGSIERLNQLAAKYSVQDTAKRMQEQANSINDGLASQTQAAQTQYQRQMDWAREYFDEHKALLTQDAEAYASYQAYISALDEKYKRDTESGLQAWIRENRDASEEYKSLWGSAMNSFTDTVTDGLMEGKLEIADFVQYVLKELIKIQMAKMIAGIATSLAGAWSGFGGGEATGATQAGYTGSEYSSWVNSQAVPHANGGIMTRWGSAKLKAYANGGIAREPQIAVFGEGSTAEAYVPLPDGRTIPVTLQGQLFGGSSNQQAQAPSVMVNVINQSGQNMDAEQTGGGFNGEQYVVDVVLKAVNRPGPLRDALKG